MKIGAAKPSSCDETGRQWLLQEYRQCFKLTKTTLINDAGDYGDTEQPPSRSESMPGSASHR